MELNFEDFLKIWMCSSDQNPQPILKTMKRIHVELVIISITILLQSSTSAQMLDVPPGDVLYSDVYDFIDRMNTRKAVTKVFSNTLPYSQTEVAEILTELDRKVKEGQLKLSDIEHRKLENLLQIFSRDKKTLHLSFHPHLFKTEGEKHQFCIDVGAGETTVRREEKTAYAILFRPTVSGQIKDDFAFYSNLNLYYLGDVQFPDIPKTEVRVAQYPVESQTAALTTYYTKFKLPWFEVFWGKDNVHWGPGRHGALMISENPLPMNMLKFTARYNPVKFQMVTGILGSDIDKKYLTGHRLELNLWKKLSLGIAETIVYGERFEITYFNPVQIYTVTEVPSKIIKGEAKETPDNLLISGDFDFFALKNVELYGEILIDDFRPFAYGLRSYRNWGSKFGFLFGCYYVDPFSLPDTDFRFEYAFINQYTYTHKHPINIYTHFDSIIGHKIGTDADDLWLNLRHWFTPNFTISMGYELERHGEGNVNKPHEGQKGTRDDDEWEFLSGVTESTHSIILSASYNLIGKYSVALEYTHTWIKNTNHQVGVNDTNNQVLLSGQYRF